MTKKTKISIILSGLACAGVVVTAYISGIDREIHHSNLRDAEEKRFDEKCPEEIKENMDIYYEDISRFEKSKWVWKNDPLSKKEKAIIFGKSYWRTFVSGGLTIGCIIGAQALELKEIIFLTGALTGIKLKYKDAMNFLKRNYPEQYREVKKFVNMESAKRAFADDKYIIERTSDGKIRAFFPFLDQVLYIKPDDVHKIQWFICARLSAKGVCTVNEVADYIHQDLGYKDIHLLRDDAYWELLPLGDEREVTEDDFPILIPDGYEDVYIEETGEELPCKVFTFENEDMPKSTLLNKYPG